jgi:hypothetical protein
MSCFDRKWAANERNVVVVKKMSAFVGSAIRRIGHLGAPAEIDPSQD